MWYSEGRCDIRYRFAKNCECLVPKDTVLRIFLTFDLPPTVSSLGFNKARYKRTPYAAYEPSATYANFIEGVVYTVVESEQRVLHIDYLPSASDCQKVIEQHANKGWQGIVPWRSTRADVEKTLGQPAGSIGHVHTYRTASNNTVDVAYSNDPCKVDYTRLSAMTDLVLKITLTPGQRILIRELELPKGYKRIQLDHPDNWLQYVNLAEGVTVDALTTAGIEEVRSISYEAPAKDREVKCGPIFKSRTTNR